MPPSAKSGMSGDFLTGKNILRRNICGPTDCLIPNSNPTHASQEYGQMREQRDDRCLMRGFYWFRYATSFSPTLSPFFMLLRPFLSQAKTDISSPWFITIPCRRDLLFQIRSSQASPAGGELGALTERGGDRHQRDVEGDQQHPDWEGGNRHQKHEETIHVTWVSRSHAFT